VIDSDARLSMKGQSLDAQVAPPERRQLRRVIDELIRATSGKPRRAPAFDER
jgi:hypothetical protein